MAPEWAPSKARTGGCAACDAWSERVSEERSARGRARNGGRTLGASRPCFVPRGWPEGGGPGPSSLPGRGSTTVAESEKGSGLSSAHWRQELRGQPRASARTCPSQPPYPREVLLRTRAHSRRSHPAGTHSHPGVQGSRRPQEGTRKAQPPTSSHPRESWFLLLFPGKQGSQTQFILTRSQNLP